MALGRGEHSQIPQANHPSWPHTPFHPCAQKKQRLQGWVRAQGQSPLASQPPTITGTIPTTNTLPSRRLSSNVRQRAHQPSPPQPCGPHPLTPQSFATKHTALQHTANDATRGPSPRLYMHMARCRQGRRRRTSAVDSPAVGAHGSPGLVTHKRGNNWRYAVNPACKRLPPPHPDAATLARTDASAEGRALLNMEQMAADSACFRACMPLRIGFPVLTVFASPVLFFALR